MASCNPSCSPTGCGGVPNGEVLLKKINLMLSDNYTLLFVLLLIFLVLGVSLHYFVGSLRKTLTHYIEGKKDMSKLGQPNTKKPSVLLGNGDPRNPMEDQEVYFPDPKKEDPTYVDPVDFMEKDKKNFLKKVDTAYKEYNESKSRYISSTYNGRENDDMVNQQMMYPEYDDYNYKLQ